MIVEYREWFESTKLLNLNLALVLISAHSNYKNQFKRYYISQRPPNKNVDGNVKTWRNIVVIVEYREWLKSTKLTLLN